MLVLHMQSSITKLYQDVIMRMLDYFSQVLLAFVLCSVQQ